MWWRVVDVQEATDFSYKTLFAVLKELFAMETFCLGVQNMKILKIL